MYVIRVFLGGSEPAKVRLPRLYSTFEAALEDHHALEALVFGKGRRTVLLAGTYHASARSCREVTVRLFDVRDSDDPAVKNLPVVKLAVLASGPGSTDPRPVIKRWARPHGYHGHEGGWVYAGGADSHHQPASAGRGRPECRLTNHQGWSSLAYWKMPEGAMVLLDHRYHLSEWTSITMKGTV